MKLTLLNLSYTTAICLAGFSGAVATYGMTKLVPGGELVVAGMGVLFEPGKLSSFALLHCGAMRQLAAAESNLAAGRAALIKAHDDRGRVKAAQAVITSAAAERDTLVKELAVARSSQAQAQSNTIEAGSEFTAINFIALATGASVDTIAHAAILTISAIPDALAVMLLLPAGYAAQPKYAPARPPSRAEPPGARTQR